MSGKEIAEHYATDAKVFTDGSYEMQSTLTQGTTTVQHGVFGQVANITDDANANAMLQGYRNTFAASAAAVATTLVVEAE